MVLTSQKIGSSTGVNSKFRLSCQPVYTFTSGEPVGHSNFQRKQDRHSRNKLTVTYWCAWSSTAYSVCCSNIITSGTTNGDWLGGFTITPEIKYLLKEVRVTDPGEQNVVGPPGVIVGAAQVITVNGWLIPEHPPITTVTWPVVAPTGTSAVIWKKLSTVNEGELMPLNFASVTVVKPLPMIWTISPTNPEVKGKWVVTSICAGWFTVTVFTPVQPLASVTFTLYVPAPIPDSVAPEVRW